MPRPRRDALPGEALCNTESGRGERVFTTIHAFSSPHVSHGSITTNYRGAETISERKRRHLRHARANNSLERSERETFIFNFRFYIETSGADLRSVGRGYLYAGKTRGSSEKSAELSLSQEKALA